MTNRRLANFDALRGIAAFAVLAGHAYGLGGRVTPIEAAMFGDIFLKASAAGVYLFFVMSGALISSPFVAALTAGESMPSPQAYVVRRILRIYPLYLGVLAAFLLTVGRGSESSASLSAHGLLLQNLVPNHQLDLIPVTWTLSIEVLFYAALPLLAWALARRNLGRPVSPERLALVVAASGVASLGVLLVGIFLTPHLPETSLFLRTWLPGLWWAFVPGILLAIFRQYPDTRGLRYLAWLRSRPAALFLVATGLFVAALGCSAAQLEWGVTPFVLMLDLAKVAWTAGFAVVALALMDRTTLEERSGVVGDWLGRLSYGTYLVHGTLLVVFTRTDLRDVVPMQSGGAVAYLVHLIFLTACTLPIAWAGWMLIERPAIAWGREFTARQAQLRR